MSIIYDALKKVEISKRRDELGPESDKRPKRKTKSYLLFILAVCVGLFAASILYEWLTPKISLKSAENKQVMPVVDTGAPAPVETKAITPEAALPALALNGVFFSEDEGYALINNRIVKKGDRIEGATVMKISMEEVDLDFGGSVIKLLNSAR